MICVILCVQYDKKTCAKNTNVLLTTLLKFRTLLKLMLSTLHAGHVIEGTKLNRYHKPIKKPDCVIAQNTHMWGQLFKLALVIAFSTR